VQYGSTVSQKPKCIVDYNRHMGVDLSDQIIGL